MENPPFFWKKPILRRYFAQNEPNGSPETPKADDFRTPEGEAFLTELAAFRASTFRRAACAFALRALVELAFWGICAIFWRELFLAISSHSTSAQFGAVGAAILLAGGGAIRRFWPFPGRVPTLAQTAARLDRNLARSGSRSRASFEFATDPGNGSRALRLATIEAARRDLREAAKMSGRERFAAIWRAPSVRNWRFFNFGAFAATAVVGFLLARETIPQTSSDSAPNAAKSPQIVATPRPNAVEESPAKDSRARESAGARARAGNDSLEFDGAAAAFVAELARAGALASRLAEDLRGAERDEARALTAARELDGLVGPGGELDARLEATLAAAEAA
ncbi:MAG: hypothetical protein HUK22_02845, partial [Thermoguttaceae bacterium]|nr:hypothetical protein [Thermoguttaceae bacterium]